MERNTRIRLSVPLKVAAAFEQLARRTHQNKSGLFCEMITAYGQLQWLKRFRRLKAYGIRRARKRNLVTEKDIDALVLEDR